MLIRERRFKQVMVTGFVVAGLAVLAVAAAASGENTTGMSVDPQTKVESIPEAESDLLKVLRQPRTTADVMPADIARVIAGSDPAKGLRFGGNLALSRSIETASGKGWVVPGNGHLCIVAPDPALPYGSPDGWGVGCVDDDSLGRTGAVLIFGQAGSDRFHLTLVVPDGATVTRRSAGGAASEARVDVDGVVAGEFNAHEVLTVRSGDGSVNELTLPPAVPSKVKVSAPGA